MKYDKNELSELLRIKKERAFEFKERRLPEWDENYLLYRNKVIYNRITQRQTVNIPLMKMAIRTMLKDIDDPPLLIFREKGGDAQKELFFNEYWNEMAKENKLVLKDILDKKQVFLYGRSFKKLNVYKGKFYFEVIDPYDIVVDRYTDPTRIDQTDYLAQINIYKPLSWVIENEAFDEEQKQRLVEFFKTQEGERVAEENTEDMERKMERLKALGMHDLVKEPQWGEAYVSLTEHYVKLEDEDLGEAVFYYVVTAEDEFVLFFAPLYELLGDTEDHFWRDHIPFTSWADDVENTDFWSDGVADILRTPNKILNSWFSQLVENRTLRNFGMHYYNSTVRNFVPQTFTPVPWGWYPVPGNPNELIKKVEIPDLSDTLNEMQFLLNIAERASAVTTTQQGVINQRKVTLGEIQLALANAKERIQSMSIFYTEDWREFGLKFVKLLESAGDKIDAVKIERKGRITNKVYERVIQPSDWQSKLGYSVEVKNVTRDIATAIDQLQKLTYAKNLMPDNKTLDEIIKKKALEFADLDAMEIKRVLEEEKEKADTMAEAIKEQMQNVKAQGQPTPSQQNLPVSSQ